MVCLAYCKVVAVVVVGSTGDIFLGVVSIGRLADFLVVLLCV